MQGPDSLTEFLHVAPLPVIVLAGEGPHRMNPAARDLLGFADDEIGANRLEQVLDGIEARSHYAELLADARHEVRQRRGRAVATPARTLRFRRPGGEPLALGARILHLPDTAVSLLLLESEPRPVPSSGSAALSHDPLTGLPTRPVALESLREALARLGRHPGHVGVLFLDLDRMKSINDRLGHQAGDLFLCDVAARLRATVRDSDTVARIGGDEFVVTVPDADSPELVHGIARRVRGVVQQPLISGIEVVESSVSVGIVITDDPRADPAQLLQDADTAMYVSKRERAGEPVVFDDALRDSVRDRARLESDLRRAVSRGEIITRFQPIVAMDGGLRGAEALVRWQHPERGELAPGAFLALAEETGVIHEIWREVLADTCRTLAAWRSSTGIAGYMSVNLSPRQFGRPRLISDLIDTLAGLAIDHSAVCLEVTETALIDEPMLAHRVLDDAADAGFRVALDDFGTGYSSLSHLREFPVSIVKIDRSFTSRIIESRTDAAIVQAMCDLALALGLEVCAEGVETPDQASALARMHCQFAQGYLWGRPEAGQAFAGRWVAA